MAAYRGRDRHFSPLPRSTLMWRGSPCGLPKNMADTIRPSALQTKPAATCCAFVEMVAAVIETAPEIEKAFRTIVRDTLRQDPDAMLGDGGEEEAMRLTVQMFSGVYSAGVLRVETLLRRNWGYSKRQRNVDTVFGLGDYSSRALLHRSKSQSATNRKTTHAQNQLPLYPWPMMKKPPPNMRMIRSNPSPRPRASPWT